MTRFLTTAAVIKTDLQGTTPEAAFKRATDDLLPKFRELVQWLAANQGGRIVLSIGKDDMPVTTELLR